MPLENCLFDQNIMVSKHVRLPFLLHLPGPALNRDANWPVILFLHGRDQRGEDLELLKDRGIPQQLEQGAELPFIVIAPQCPGYCIWPAVFDGVMAIVDEVARTHPVDRSRIYLTGLSMGGYAAWDLAMEYPGRFAAIAPVSGSASQERLQLLQDVPVWAFHGAKDDIVPAAEISGNIAAINAVGGNARLTLYPDGDHDAWTEAYRNPQLYKWFLEHTLNP
ncbi:prolyl oligopeptidase family serine peptidase [Paenibacillus tengchongensis]|uniref:carboxylesterase family protein n=1 Tax=Paenibacillus tengchongensis TaxID=2608684 RepID=UPI00124F2922|nr:prolyl oligopeptidase family serine peptidase [Paenibacillus tengchongensis]